MTIEINGIQYKSSERLLIARTILLIAAVRVEWSDHLARYFVFQAMTWMEMYKQLSSIELMIILFGFHQQ